MPQLGCAVESQDSGFLIQGSRRCPQAPARAYGRWRRGLRLLIGGHWDDGGVDCWVDYYYCYYPWPIDVTVQSGAASLWTWLGPVLLFGASLVASGVAYFGIRKSNETSEAAITAADNREVTKWRRETLLKLASDANVAAVELSMAMRRARDRKSSDTVDPRDLDTLRSSIRLLRDLADHLLLIGATRLSTFASAVFEASREVVEAYVDLSTAKAQMGERMSADVEKLSELGADSPEEIEEHEKAVYAELVAGPLAIFDTATEMLASARRAFVKEAQRQLNLQADSEPLPGVDAR